MQNVPLSLHGGWTECRCCLLGCHACIPTVPDHSQVPVVIAAYERVGRVYGGWIRRREISLALRPILAAGIADFSLITRFSFSIITATYPSSLMYSFILTASYIYVL